MNQQAELLRIQQALAESLGEPIMLSIRVVYDDWFEVEIRTPADRFGMASGRELETAIAEAEIMVLELDRVVAELRPAQG